MGGDMHMISTISGLFAFLFAFFTMIYWILEVEIRCGGDDGLDSEWCWKSGKWNDDVDIDMGPAIGGYIIFYMFLAVASLIVFITAVMKMSNVMISYVVFVIVAVMTLMLTIWWSWTAHLSIDRMDVEDNEGKLKGQIGLSVVTNLLAQIIIFFGMWRRYHMAVSGDTSV